MRLVAGLMLAGVLVSLAMTGVATAQDSRPLMKLLPRFTSASVPKMAPEETETPAS